MAVDFTKYRADVNDALAQAMSSRDTNAVQTQTTSETINAQSRAWASAGQAIGHGLEQAFDPSRALARSAQVNAYQAQNEDLSKQREASNIRAGASEQTPDQLFGNLGDNASLAKQLYQSKRAGGLPWDQVPPEARADFEMTVGNLRNQKLLVNQAQPGAGLPLGKHGGHENIGYSVHGEAQDQWKQMGDQAIERMMAHPSYQRAMFRESERQREIGEALQRPGGLGVAQVYKDFSNNRKYQEEAPEFAQIFESDQLIETEWGVMTPKELFYKGLGTPQNLQKLVKATRTRAPSVAVTTGANGTPEYHRTWDEKVFENVSTKEAPEDRAVAASFLGQPMDHAYPQWAGYQASKGILKQLQSKEWTKGLKGKDAITATGLAGRLDAQIKKLGDGPSAALVANLTGLADIPKSAMAKNKLVPGDVAGLTATIQDISKLSPNARRLLSKSSDPTKPTEADLLKRQIYSGGMVDGPFDVGPGPLAVLEKLHIDAGDASVLGATFVKAGQQQPHYEALVNTLVAGGVDATQAKRLATLNMGLFDSAVTAGFQTIDEKTGKPATEWPKAEQEKLRQDLASDFAKQHISEYHYHEGVSATQVVNELKGQPESMPSKRDADEIASNAVAVSPDLKDAPYGEVGLPSRGALLMRNGRAVGVRDEKGKVTAYEQKNPYSQRLTEALHIAGINMKFREGQADSIGRSAKHGTGDALIDTLLQRPLVGGKTNFYDWARDAMRQHGDAGSKSDEWGEGIDAHLNTLAIDEGYTPWQLSEKLNAAAASTKDPVLEGLATFYAEALSPQPNTRAQLKAIEGQFPADAVSEAGRIAAEEKLQQGDPSAKEQLFQMNGRGDATVQKSSAESKANIGAAQEAMTPDLPYSEDSMPGQGLVNDLLPSRDRLNKTGIAIEEAWQWATGNDKYPGDFKQATEKAGKEIRRRRAEDEARRSGKT